MISLNLSQYLLDLVFSCFSYSPLLETVYVLLFSPKLNDALLNLSQIVPPNPSSFQREWSFTGFWDQFEEILIKRYIELLKRVDSYPDNVSNSNPFGSRAFHKEPTAQGILGFLNVGRLFFSDSTDPTKLTDSLEEEHRNLTRFTGVVTDPNVPEVEKIVAEAPLVLMIRFKENFVSTLVMN